MVKPFNYPECPMARVMDKSLSQSSKISDISAYLKECIKFNSPTCYSRRNRVYSCTSCTCLHDFFNSIQEIELYDALLECIALYFITFVIIGRKVQGLIFSTMVNYNRNGLDLYNDNETKEPCNYLLPILRDAKNTNLNEDLPRVWICCSALQWILNLKCDKWKSLMAEAKGNYIYNHHLKNKISNSALSEEIKMSLSRFLEDMTELSCPRATRIVRSVTGMAELRDVDDELNELPSNLTHRRRF
jgi:hypothetical protein